MSLSFHSRTGTFITLSNNNRTAQRDHPAQEFNNGIVLSSEPLRDNQLFEVRIDKKVNSWSGSVEIGVTASDPNNLQFPTSATGFRENTWVMSGSSILKDGHTIIEEYGQDLDQICEGDTVGVKRLPGGVLHIFINGVDHGPAVANLPSKLYAVVDLYGKCAMVTVVDNDSNRESMSNDVANTAIAEGPSSYIYSNERLLFHERCGTLGKLSNNRRTAERRRPLDEFNNGVVMTNRPLKDDELFEIRIDRLVDKWSGSIEVGITTHNPSLLDFPATMTNMRSGTIMMSGCGILTNGKGTRREYGEYNLDDLAEGDRIGLIKKSNGCLHYYINGIDQGVAATKTAQVVWGVVDLYGMAVKVTIVDGSETNRYQAVRQAQPNSLFRRFREMHTEDEEDESQEVEKLLFHSNCGYCAEIINGNRTAHRPNAMDDFNHGVCITNRVLRTNEIFEVRIDKMVDKWAGSIEIGVTTHSPQTLDYPSTMTNIRSGTWMMTGHGVMHNGTTVIDEYGQNLDRLKVGDRLGVIRKEDGTLHFFVNSVDQGPAASNVPSNVYGVLDLYGQAAQATIIDQSDPTGLPELVVSEATPTSDDICFHHLHGQNASVINNGKTAVRTSALEDFNDAIVIGNRPLRDNEIFEVVIEKMVDRWSGSIEAGVTLMRPETIEFPNTMTDMDHDTWMLSGSGIMQDGSTIRSGYGIDLDTIDVNSRIGMMRTSEGDLHYFVNGQDQGVACSGIPPNVYPVVDIYGQCAQVSITNGTRTHAMENQYVQVVDPTLTSPTSTEITHRFSQCCGKNVNIRGSGSTACRVRNFNNGLVFSCDPLKSDELFEVKVDQIARQWSGTMHIGLTTMAISDNTPVSILPATATELNSKSKISWVVCGSEVKKNGVVVKENYATALERLEVGSRVGVRRSSDGTMHIHINGQDMGTAATGIPKNIFAVIDLYGMMEGVTVISSKVPELMNASLPVSIRSDSSDSLEKETDQDTAESISLNFHSNHGKNILLSNKNTTACRTASYNQGIVISSKPLPRNHIFQVKIERLNQRWTSSLLIGVIGFNPEKQAFPHCAIAIKKPSWVVQGDCVFQNGAKVKDHYGPNIDSLHAGHVVGVMVDDANCLHLYVNGIDQGIAARDIPVGCHAIVDLYGQCEQVTTVTESDIVEDTFGADREKADIEEGKKEKICKTPPPEINKIKSCEYMHMCSRFKSVLGLPDGYFEPKHNMCYCELCHKVRGDEGYYKRGEPPKEYALPFGWCRFALKVHQRAQVLNVFEKWHIAYHGTKVQCIRKVLDCGDLLIPGDIAMGGSQLMPQPGHFTENKKPENFDVKQIFLSPTIRYSGHDVYAPKYEFKDPKTKKIFHARVAMQVYVKPGSYKIGPQTIGANEQIDPKFQNNELEWSTKERGSIILYGLLIKIEQ